VLYFNCLLNNTNSTLDTNARLLTEQAMASLNMTMDQILEFEQNWNDYWWLSYENLTSNFIASNATYQNMFGLAYWQWANSTYSEAVDGQPSWKWVQQYHQFYGYYEMLYFKQQL